MENARDHGSDDHGVNEAAESFNSLPGVPSRPMHHENLWAPWRMAYLRDLNRRRDVSERAHGADALGAATEPGAPSGAPGGADREAAPPKDSDNFLSTYWQHPEDDQPNLVVHRDAHGMILLNRYPYANGHLLVALGEARPTVLDYPPPKRAAFWRLIECAAALMDRALNPQGINFGINQGDAAGAGVPEHLHAHLVPRWSADTNFIGVIGGVRVIPDALEAMHEHYRAVLPTVLTDCGS